MIIYCDGGSRGNPGPAASAYVATVDGKVISQEGKYLDIQTNNFAEYTAVLLAVKWLTKQLSTSKLQFPMIINLDSQLVERQLNGFYKIKNEKLKQIANQIRALVNEYKLPVEFRWGYRTDNKLADSLVNETLDTASLQREKRI